jgi:hypothetical protein
MGAKPKRRRPEEETVPTRALFSDRCLDRTLDALTVAAGLPANTSALNLARWDLKAALRDALIAEGALPPRFAPAF